MTQQPSLPAEPPAEPLEDEGFVGEAELDVDGRVVRISATLRGGFQPIDGRYHWHGRVGRTSDLDGGSGSEVVIRTPFGEAVGKLSDLDPWGRLRITGEGRPPFHTDLRDAGPVG